MTFRSPKTKIKRSNQKLHSRHGEILRYMRMSRGISMRDAGDMNGCSYSLVNHYENGRTDLVENRVWGMVASYGYTREEYEAFLAGKPIPMLNLKKECVLLLDRIDDHKLRAVHAVLVGFVAGRG